MPVPGMTLYGTNQALDSLVTIQSEFDILRDATGVCRSCARSLPLLPHQGTAKNVLNYNRVSAFAVADGVDIAQAQTLADTTTSYSPGEVAVQVTLAGSAMRRSPDPELLRRTGTIVHNAYDLKEDTDGCAQFPSFTPVVSSANTVLGIGHLWAASARLGIGNDRTNPEPGPAPWFCVLHPLQASIIGARLIPLNAVAAGTTAAAVAAAGDYIAIGHSGGMQDEILRRGINAIGMLGNAVVKVDPYIAVDASDDASGAFFSKEGFIFVPEVEPRMDNDTSDKSLRGAVEVNFWGSYTWGLYRSSNYGIEVLADATLPTS